MHKFIFKVLLVVIIFSKSQVFSAGDLLDINNSGLSSNRTITGILPNPLDVNMKVLSYKLTGVPKAGTVSFDNLTRQYTYKRNNSSSEADSFEFDVVGGNGSTVNVIVMINALSKQPLTAYDCEISGYENTFIRGLLKASDNDYVSPLIYAVVKWPSHGKVALDRCGRYTYATYNPNFYGIDKFSYMVFCEGDTSNVANVTITLKPIVGVLKPFGAPSGAFGII